MHAANRRMGSRPASLKRWHGEATITSGGGKSRGFLPGLWYNLSMSPGSKRDRLAHEGRHARRRKTPPSPRELTTTVPPGHLRPSVSPMNDVTRILSEVGQGDP